MSLIAGITPAVQGIVARKAGEDNTLPNCMPLNGGLLIALIIGTPLTFLCYYFTPLYFSYVTSNPKVLSDGIVYLRALLLATIAIGFMRAFIGYWSGISRTKVIMVIEVLMNVINGLFNYMLIFGNFGAPEMGIEGAGIASAISYVVATILFFGATFVINKRNNFLNAMPSKKLLKKIFIRGIPAIIQDMFFAAGFVVLFIIISHIGEEEVAAATVLTRITIIMLLFAMALGMASSTLVSNALGQGNIEKANKWAWDTGIIGIVSISLLGLPMFLFPEDTLLLFMVEGKALNMAVIPLQLIAMTTGLVSLIYVFSITLFSIGHGVGVLIVSFVMQWLIFLPAAWYIGLYLNMGLLEIWIAYTLYTLLAALFVTLIWQQGKWKVI
jgi:MATE family multidrug resistance protein